MLDCLVDDALVCFLTCLPVREVGCATALNRRLCSIAQSEAVWCALCEYLWCGKALPTKFLELRDSGKACEAYRQSLLDSRRTSITKEELCSICWSFRFKACAGDGWQESDPWWQGQAATKARFYPSGIIRFQSGGVLGNDPPKLRWRFVRFQDQHLEDLEQQRRNVEGFEFFSGFGQRGVRAKVMGREVPAYCIRRHKGNWGWVMESCWVVWCSWPMHARGSDEGWELDDERLPVTFECQRQQASEFNMGLVGDAVDFVEDAEPDSEENYRVIQYGANYSIDQDTSFPAEDGDDGDESETEIPDPQRNDNVILVLDNFQFRVPRHVVQGVPVELLEALLRSRIEAYEREARGDPEQHERGSDPGTSPTMPATP